MEHNHITRRRFLLGASQFVQAPARLSEKPQNALGSPHIDSSGYTPTAYFFRQQIRPITPINADTWSVTIDGLVQNPMTLTYSDLLALPSIETPCTIACIRMNAQNTLIGHGLWRGVPIRDLIPQIGVSPEAAFVQFTSVDGYTTYIQHGDLENALLVYGMNGETLPHEHGFPARLIVPGLYDFKMPKWIQRIEFTNTPRPGRWELQGWSTTGYIQTISTIFTPHPSETITGTVALSGIAFAGGREITNIEISVDDGLWMPVPFEPTEPYSWTTWQIDWTPPAPGSYLFKVRATDSAGFTQPDSAPIFPQGSSAIQAIVVRVTA